MTVGPFYAPIKPPMWVRFARRSPFLDDVKDRKSESTHRSYRFRLLRALKILATTLRVCDVSKLHLAKIERKLTNKLSPTTIRDTIATVQLVFGWALRHDLISENRLLGFEKPRGRVRTRIITPDEFQSLLRYSDVRFRRVLLSLRMTGCRPRRSPQSHLGMGRC